MKLLALLFVLAFVFQPSLVLAEEKKPAAKTAVGAQAAVAEADALVDEQIDDWNLDDEDLALGDDDVAGDDDIILEDFDEDIPADLAKETAQEKNLS